MRRAIKSIDSEMVTIKLQYSSNSSKIAGILFAEQKGYCAYTDEFISITDAKDIEHFNPNLKNTAADNYNNWFLVKHQWNMEKGTVVKWEKFQPILHPTATDFEDRIIYVDGDYAAKSSTDTEANNLVKLLNLDSAELAEKRKKYIKRWRGQMDTYGQDPETYFTILMEDNSYELHYLRAIKEEFKVDLWSKL